MPSFGPGQVRRMKRVPLPRDSLVFMTNIALTHPFFCCFRFLRGTHAHRRTRRRIFGAMTRLADFLVLVCVAAVVASSAAESMFKAQQLHKVSYSMAELQQSVPMGRRTSSMPAIYETRTDPYRLVQSDCSGSTWVESGGATTCAAYAYGHASGRYSRCSFDLSANGVLARDGCAECGECGNFYLADAVTAPPGEVPCVDAAYVLPPPPPLSASTHTGRT
jgi:hypothetical protein